MLTLHALPGGWGLSSGSPFVTKLETWLRIAGIPYTVDRDPRKSGPKGKFPWVRLPDGEVLCDSSHIIAALSERHGVDLDAGLDAPARARSLLLQRTFEDHLYFCVLYLRWQDDEGWEQVRPVFFRGLPPVVSSIAPAFIRSGVRKSLHGQGTGRHSRDEVEAAGRADLDAAAALLGDQPWMLGDRPRTIDATTHAFLDSVHRGPSGGLGDHLRSHANLVAYVERGWAAWWPELDEPATS